MFQCYERVRISQGFDIAGLDMPELLAKSLERAGITEPTLVQREAIPIVLSGRDVVIQSGTGTGKTLAYALPLLQRIRADEKFRAVVVAPSPELAVQISLPSRRSRALAFRAARSSVVATPTGRRTSSNSTHALS